MSPLEKARSIARDETLDVASPDLSLSLLTATQEKFECDHSTSAQLKKSTELNAYLRLLGDGRIYPDARFLQERLGLAVEILERCPQRPVLEQTAILLLELDIAYAWTTSHPHIIEAILALDTKQSRHCTIPMLALCMHHSTAFAADFAARIASSNLTAKKVRVGELVETLHILPRDRPLDDFVELSYEAIFAGTTPEDKVELLRRVILESFEEPRTYEEIWENIGGSPRVSRPHILEHGRWVLLIDPIIAQNLHNREVVDMLSQLMTVLPEQHATRYLTNYTMSMAQHRRMLTDKALDLLEVHAGAALIPFLYPSTQLTARTLVGMKKKTPYAERVEQVISAIIEREQLDRNTGGLSLSEQSSGGGLTVLDARHGTLSIDAVAATPTDQRQLDPATLLPPIHAPDDPHGIDRAPHAKMGQERFVLLLIFIMTALAIYLLF